MKSFWIFLKKNKLYGAVNLVGLTMSMAFVLLLAVYVQRQLSTDSFHEIVGDAPYFDIPAAWFIMNRWLSGYGHRISLHWWIFVLAGLVVALVAAVSVLYQSVKTAGTNPAEALKKE